jgi:hypothetical protein
MKYLTVMVVIFLCFIGSLKAYPVKEIVFENSIPPVIIYQEKEDGKESNVEVIIGKQNFVSRVLQSSTPAVVTIGTKSGEFTEKLSAICQELADDIKLKSQIRFGYMDITKNTDIISSIGSKLKLKKIELPLVLFIKNGQIILPIISGFISKPDLLQRIRRSLLVQG